MPVTASGCCLAEEDRAGVELVAAQLGHQAGAGLVVEPPADQLVVVVVLVGLAVGRLVGDGVEVDLVVTVLEGGLPGVVVERVAVVVAEDDGVPLVVERILPSLVFSNWSWPLLRCQEARMWRISPRMPLRTSELALS